jgi:uncharacterized protein YodC (DUF2158 family)
MAEFNKGDVVILKSGGPLMTIHSIEGDGRIYCVWFQSSSGGYSDQKGTYFQPEVLKKKESH